MSNETKQPPEFTGMVWDLAKICQVDNWQWFNNNRFVHFYQGDKTIIYEAIKQADYQKEKPWVFCLRGRKSQ